MKKKYVFAGTLALTLVLGLGSWLVYTIIKIKPSPEKMASSGLAGARKLLYYRNPMGLADTSPVPKKDSMGMDYIPVYSDEQSTGASLIQINAGKVQQMGIRTESASLLKLSRTLHLLGRIEADERHQYAIAPKFDGWIIKLNANTTGQAIKKGESLFEVYSPELISTQTTLLSAIKYAGRKTDSSIESGIFSILPQSDMALATAVSSYEAGASDFNSILDAHWQIRRALEEFTRRIRLPKGTESIADDAIESQSSIQRMLDSIEKRLKNWDISDADIKSLKKTQKVSYTMPYRSPVSGILAEKPAIQGQRFRAGDTLLKIYDISTVWILADVFERDITDVQIGQMVRIKMNAFPKTTLEGRITYIYPTVNSQTRSVPVRIEVNNQAGLLRPGMFTQADIQVGSGPNKVLAIPSSAVVDSGNRQQVFIQRNDGQFEARNVVLGVRGDDHVQIISGVVEGEKVVVSGNFLIDSESNLNAAIKGMVPQDGASVKTHHAEGVVDNIDHQDGTLMITHQPVASLNWPVMTMEFIPAHSGMLNQLTPGKTIAFDFVERKPGEWVITQLEIRTKANAIQAH